MLDEWVILGCGSFLLPTLGFLGNHLLAGHDPHQARKISLLFLPCAALAMLAGQLLGPQAFLVSLLSVPIALGALSHASLLHQLSP